MTFNAKDRRLEGATPLRQCQLTQLYLLEVFAEICDEHNLKYFLDAGTLIGAMRHKGFIPWDDDLDVGMPEKDYKKFLTIAEKELPEGILLQTPKKYPGVPVPYAKLRDRYSFYCEPNSVVQLPCGIFMDIFPFVKYPKLPLSVTGVIGKWCYYSWISECVYRTRQNGSVIGVFFSSCKALAWYLIYLASKGLFNLLTLFSKHVLKYSPEIGWWDYPGFEESDIFPLVKREFEGRMFYTPKDSDKFLTTRYGDWRTPPSEAARRIHHSIICPTQAPEVPWAMKYPLTSENP